MGTASAFADLPSRVEILRAHKSQGGKVAAVFPIHYPKALLRAFEVLPIEVWGPPGIDPSPAAAHLQTYACSIVQGGLSFLLSGGLDPVDFLVVPHACDSLQGLGSLLLDYLKPPKPVWPFYLPRGNRDSDLEFLTREFAALFERLEEATGRRPTGEDLLARIGEEETAVQRQREILERRRQLPLSNLEFYRLLRAREFLPTVKFLALAEAALARLTQASRPGSPVLLSGIVPEPAGMLEALDQAKALVVADDLVCLGRRLYPAGAAERDPLRRMARSILEGPPDATRGASIADRLGHLKRLALDSGARGVIFYQVKFCEPEAFLLPGLRQGLQESGLPSVVVEVDLSERLPQQVVTRLEAFLELLRRIPLGRAGITSTSRCWAPRCCAPSGSARKES